MRRFYLAAYDIVDNRRRHSALRFLRRFSIGGQKSFFECFLSDVEKRQVISGLRAILEPAQDRFVLIGLDPRSRVVSMGVALPPAAGPFLLSGR